MSQDTAEEPIIFGETEELEESPVEDLFIAKDINEWIGDFEYVEAVLYDCNSRDGVILVEAGKLNEGVAKAWTKQLTPEEVTLLKTFITGKREGTTGMALCYAPHHGFVFYGKDSKILGHIQICFMCKNYHSLPRHGLSTIWDLEGLKALTAKKGLPNFENPDEWAAFFANKELVAKGEMKQPTADNKPE